MKWRRFAFIVMAICLTLTLFASFGPASAAASNVKVTIFKSGFEINGMKLNNAKARYPVLVYKGITYFPMSSDHAKALGMPVHWSKSKGLTIHTAGSRYPLKESKSGSNSFKRSYSAQIASLPIQIDDMKINNAKEKYPVLQFRDVPYFPMVPRFTNDLFHWNMEGSAKTGYRIRSNQMPVLYKFVYDDADYLYMESGTEGILKISKKLDGKFFRTNEKESRSILAKYEAQSRKYALPQPNNDEAPITANGESVFYGDQELTSLLPYREKEKELLKNNPTLHSDSGIDFTYNWMKLDDKISLLHLRVYYMNHIPAPYTPHEDHIFVIHEGEVKKITGYSQWPDKLGKTPDGGYWISSYAPPDYELTAADFDTVGQLALIDKNGESYSINELLKVRDIDLLYADSQSLLIKAYNDRLDPAAAGKTDGIYMLDSASQKAVKVTDAAQGVGYVDSKKQLFILDPKKNTITNVTAKKSHRWWDYELRSNPQP